jgi:molybdopterin/thiamine biosynthesis adenylyltransferase/nitroreductase
LTSMTTVADPLSLFDYRQAFVRNIGWVTEAEQAQLRSKRVAIAGLGGVGGVHLVTLARLGVGAFTLAEADVFELPNFNRQLGAGMSTVGRAKLDVLAATARDINPELDVRMFPEGVTKDNVEKFLEEVDLYVDGLDFFAFEARRLIFDQCARRRIPAVTVAPLGMGAALLNFLPGGMTFEEYFRWKGCSEEEMALRFLVGLAPAGLHRSYLVDPTAVDFAARRGPSTAMACQLCAGIAASEALKILLRRGQVLAAPRGAHFDAYRNRMARTWRPMGNRNPIQRMVLAMARRQFKRALGNRDAGSVSSIPVPEPIAAILDLARWAPSGDNTQPWRFEVVGQDHFVVHGFDTREDVVYDLDGRPSQLSIGALLESIRIAASGSRLSTDIRLRADATEAAPKFDVFLRPVAEAKPDPLLPFLRERCVQRRPLRTRPLSANEKGAMEAAAGPGHRILWLEGWQNRVALARILFANGKVRLTMPEAYAVHRDAIEWGAQFSEDRVPDQAVGLDPLTVHIMRWAMESWKRVDFVNRLPGGTLGPRLQLDLLPALGCAAHFVLRAERPPKNLADWVDAGRAMQRVWLTATSLGLQMQPETTPLIFRAYVRGSRRFTQVDRVSALAATVADRLDRLIGTEALDSAVFLARVGAGPRARSRSVRLPVQALLRS